MTLNKHINNASSITCIFLYRLKHIYPKSILLLLCNILIPPMVTVACNCGDLLLIKQCLASAQKKH